MFVISVSYPNQCQQVWYIIKYSPFNVLVCYIYIYSHLQYLLFTHWSVQVRDEDFHSPLHFQDSGFVKSFKFPLELRRRSSSKINLLPCGHKIIRWWDGTGIDKNASPENRGIGIGKYRVFVFFATFMPGQTTETRESKVARNTKLLVTFTNPLYYFQRSWEGRAPQGNLK